MSPGASAPPSSLICWPRHTLPAGPGTSPALEWAGGSPVLPWSPSLCHCPLKGQSGRASQRQGPGPGRGEERTRPTGRQQRIQGGCDVERQGSSSPRLRVPEKAPHMHGLFQHGGLWTPAPDGKASGLQLVGRAWGERSQTPWVLWLLQGAAQHREGRAGGHPPCRFLSAAGTAAPALKGPSFPTFPG